MVGRRPAVPVPRPFAARRPPDGAPFWPSPADAADTKSSVPDSSAPGVGAPTPLNPRGEPPAKACCLPSWTNSKALLTSCGPKGQEPSASKRRSTSNSSGASTARSWRPRHRSRPGQRSAPALPPQHWHQRRPRQQQQQLRRALAGQQRINTFNNMAASQHPVSSVAILRQCKVYNDGCRFYIMRRNTEWQTMPATF